MVTGRVADASLDAGARRPSVSAGSGTTGTGPAGGSAAGHMIECGAQATGGLWHRWDELSDLANVGYPIAEIAPDGSCVITKPRDRRPGRVGTVTEQLLYEIDDPAHYRTPDVDVDFTTVAITTGGDRVTVRGRRAAPTDQLKLVAVYRDGWTASGMLAVVGETPRPRPRGREIVLDECAGPDIAGRFAGRMPGCRRRGPGVFPPAARRLKSCCE